MSKVGVPVQPVSRPRRSSLLLIVASFVLLIFHVLCFAFRPDFAALWTLFPFWLFGLPAGLLALCIRTTNQQRRLRTILIVAWGISVLCISDETIGLLRWRSRPPLDSLRVVSLNCSVGTPEAAREVIAQKPDLVLLQESPSRQDVQNLARQMWKENGKSVWGVDGSVLANGDVKLLKLPANVDLIATAARVRVKGKTFVAVSFRLSTPPFRVDLWSPSAWSALVAHRKLQRAQMRSLIGIVKSLEPSLPIIIAGDCNAPSGDAIFRELQPLLHDAYREGGVGWCNTFQNDFPILRIDQMWLSHQWKAAYVSAQQTQNSDHRMVICHLLPHSKN